MIEIPPTARMPDIATSTAKTTGMVVLIQSSPMPELEDFFDKNRRGILVPENSVPTPVIRRTFHNSTTRSMNSRAESPSATNSALALSLLYVEEIALLLGKVRRLVLTAVLASAFLMIMPIMALAGLSDFVEEIMPFEEELLVGLVLLFIIIPAVAYFTILSTSSMGRWKSRLDGLSFALCFESQLPSGESPSTRLAYQAVSALALGHAENHKGIHPSEFANSKLGGETYEVVVPDPATRKLSGHRGALVIKRFEGKEVGPKDLGQLVVNARSSGARLWRLLVVSDRKFPPETSDLHASLSAKSPGFPVDLVEETLAGFSVIALGT